MPLRPPAGFISAFFDPLNNPNAPTIGTATAGDATASVTFTAPTNVGGSAISSYSALSTPGGVVASAASSPISVTGLSNGTAYTFAVWATNTYGPSAYSAASNSVSPALPRGVFGGGQVSGNARNVIDYITISSVGNATDFGDLAIARQGQGSCASSTRGIFAGGYSTTYEDAIYYITISSTGNTSSFGTLASGRAFSAGLSNSTRGVIGGGTTGSTTASCVYITIATTGNSTSFGDLTQSRLTAGACASPTRGVFAGGGQGNGTKYNVIDYITIATTGNAIDFGDLSTAVQGMAGCSSSTRGLFGGGETSAANFGIAYITIATTGNAVSFGSLSVASVFESSACASPTRGVFAGGNTVTNVIQYVTIDTTGNSTDFGDLTLARGTLSGLSNCHGGL
jgi:hypothetical protein